MSANAANRSIVDAKVAAPARRRATYISRWQRVASRRYRWGRRPIDFAYDFSGSRLAMHLGQEEAALIDFYRTMSDADRLALLHIARSMAEREEAKAAARPHGFRPGPGEGGAGR